MQLFYRRLGKGRPFVILHGLYGMSDNWVGFARNLASGYQFFIPDLRNHGQSGHADEFNYEVLADDVYKWLNEQKIIKPVIMGHSMGGKIAMELVKRYPDIASALIILDISPLSYKKFPRMGLLNHKHVLQSMLSVNLLDCNTREQIGGKLLSSLKDNALSSFLTKNAARDTEGNFYWRLHLQSLADNLHHLSDGITDEDFSCQIPSLFVKGQESDYIIENDKEAISKFYPESVFVEIPQAGHWLHVSHEKELISAVSAYLSSLSTNTYKNLS